MPTVNFLKHTSQTLPLNFETNTDDMVLVILFTHSQVVIIAIKGNIFHASKVFHTAHSKEQRNFGTKHVMTF